MKEIKATIQPHMLSKVIQALHELPHFPGFTVIKCQGQGRGRGRGGAFVPTEDDIAYQARERIEITCADDDAEGIVEIIWTHAHTGNSGDGIVTVSDLAFVTRIRTREMGDTAV